MAMNIMFLVVHTYSRELQKDDGVGDPSNDRSKGMEANEIKMLKSFRSDLETIKKVKKKKRKNKT